MRTQKSENRLSVRDLPVDERHTAEVAGGVDRDTITSARIKTDLVALNTDPILKPKSVDLAGLNTDPLAAFGAR